VPGGRLFVKIILSTYTIYSIIVIAGVLSSRVRGTSGLPREGLVGKPIAPRREDGKREGLQFARHIFWHRLRSQVASTDKESGHITIRSFPETCLTCRAGSPTFYSSNAIWNVLLPDTLQCTVCRLNGCKEDMLRLCPFDRVLYHLHASLFLPRFAT